MQQPGIHVGRRTRSRSCVAKCESGVSETQRKECTVTCPIHCPHYHPSDGECNGHGVCSRTPVRCTDAATCSAVCVCEDGFVGTGCQVSGSDLGQAQGTRTFLLNTVG